MRNGFDLHTKVSSTQFGCLLTTACCTVMFTAVTTQSLQDDLDSLQASERDWLMEFNPSKSEAITFTKKTKPVHTKYTFYDQTLATVSSARYSQ